MSTAAPARTFVPPAGRSGNDHRQQHPAASPAKEQWARIIVWVYALASVLSVALWILSWARPSFVHWPRVVLGALNIPVGPSLVSVVGLFLVTGALIRRKRIALVLVAVFELAGLLFSSGVLVWAWSFDFELAPDPSSAVLDVGIEAVSVVAAVAALWLSWWVRAAFPARTRPGSWLAAGLTLLGGAVLSAVLTRVLLLAATDTASDDWTVLAESLLRAAGLRGGGPRVHEVVPHWIPVLTSMVLALAMIMALYMFLRPARRNQGWSGDQEVALRGLLTAHGELDSLGYFATRRDKELVFSPDGRAAVAYRVVGGVCLAAGDPVGDPAAWPQAVAVWKARVRQYGWVPAVLAASEAGARVHVAAGLAVMALGDEALLHTDRFSLASTSMTEVRRAVRRARRSGITVRIRRHSELSVEELGRLGELAGAWRGGESDRGFSMALNRWGDPADGQCVVVTAHSREDQTVVGLLSFVPWSRRGLSLDVMRRSPQAPNGTTELMIAELMDQGPGRGVLTVSLNFAMFRGVFADAQRLGAGGLRRMNGSVLGFFDRYFQLERLYRANAKYHPEWVPRYLCFDGTLALTRAAVAAAQAEGFLPDPLAPTPEQHHLDEVQLRRAHALETAPTSGSMPGPRRTQQTAHRLRHARMLQEAGMTPHPVGASEASSVCTVVLPGLGPEAAGQDAAHLGEVRVYGRVRAIRHHGGVLFLDLTDGGTTVQAVLERRAVGPDRFRLLASALDTGDLVVVTGRPGHSGTGTPSLLVTELTMAAKALHPVPFTGFADPGARARRRSTDLLVHPGALEILRRRSAAVTAVRSFLTEQGYQEVETPILNTVHGGATARPFRTYINAYGVDLTLRIAPELYLKRLLVAGAGPIFELGRNFRNEGADATHNPEFTSLEAYQPFGDYHQMRRLTEALIKSAATAVHGAPVLPLRNVHDADAVLTEVSGPWPVIPVTAAVSEAVGRPVSVNTDFEELLSIARDRQVQVGPAMGPGAVLEELYGELVEPATSYPTFYTDFPAETSPLTAPHRKTPGLVERWDLVANGMEIGTAYSELTDPLEQRRRFTAQSLKAAAGDLEAMEIDEDFLYALETGMPPAGGLGIGMDRLVMLLTDTTIREVLTFPFVRPSPRGS